MKKKKTNHKKLLNKKENLADIQELIRERISFLEGIVIESETKLPKMPEGSLVANKHGTSYQYYWKHGDNKDPQRTYITNKQQDIAKSLAQKSYLKQVSSIAKKELKLLYPISKLDSAPIEDIYQDLADFRKALITPYAIPQADYVNEWNNVPCPICNSKDDTVFLTNRGEKVRSKSEVNIANMLDHYGIPYRYEYSIVLDGYGPVNPDFTCLNTRTRKEFIWEHFGMMDDIGYLRKNYSKLESYELNGYMPGINFISTFETSKQPLDSRIIKATIETYLI